MILNWKWKNLPFNCRLEQLGQLPEKKSLLFQVEKLKKRRKKVEKWKICLSTAVSQGHLGRLAE